MIIVDASILNCWIRHGMAWLIKKNVEIVVMKFWEYICIFIFYISGKVYRFYGEGLQRFEKCLDLEKNCFTDPLNFGFAPLQVQESQRCGDYEEFDGVLTDWTKLGLTFGCINLNCILKLPYCANGYVTLTWRPACPPSGRGVSVGIRAWLQSWTSWEVYSEFCQNYTAS